jgi:hypothetical protein
MYLSARILGSSLRIAHDLRMRSTDNWTQVQLGTNMLFKACIATANVLPFLSGREHELSADRVTYYVHQPMESFTTTQQETDYAVPPRSEN